MLKNGTKLLKIEIAHSAAFGVHGALAKTLRRAGFQLDVGGAKIHYSQFVIDAAFGAEEEQALDRVVELAQASQASILDRALGRFQRPS